MRTKIKNKIKNMGRITMIMSRTLKMRRTTRRKNTSKNMNKNMMKTSKMCKLNSLKI